MRVMLTGAGGMLGWDWAVAMENRGWEVIRMTHEELDIGYPRKVQKLVSGMAPDMIANAAAFTKVDACEYARDLAMKINFEGAANLAQSANEKGIPVVHISTDYVFDGEKPEPYRENDAPNPVSAYGESKWLGERAIREITANHCIVRASWLFGHHGPNFVETVIRLAHTGKPLRMVDDQVGAPTYTRDLSEALCDLMAANARGTYHLTGGGSCSWFEFAGAILKGISSPTPVEPISSDQLTRPARRPRNSRMADTRTAALGMRSLRHWREALTDYLARREPEPEEDME